MSVIKWPMLKRGEIGLHGIQAGLAAMLFSRWSMRGRAGQILPVAVAFLLLVGTAQAVGAFHDISSDLTQQQIAKSWRGRYDLLIRPQSSVSGTEAMGGWIDPQSVLENYGGIDSQQVASILALSEVAQVVPFANIGWQSVAMQLPVELPSRGIYRVSARWQGQKEQVDGGSEVVRYVDVTDFADLSNTMLISSPQVAHLIAKNGLTPVVYNLPVEGIQAVIGVTGGQQQELATALLEDVTPAVAARFSLHVERLQGEVSRLPGCLSRSDCWAPMLVRVGTMSYQVDGVQLLRYSRVNYLPSSQRLAAGQVVAQPLGEDMQGALYRTQLTEHVGVPNNQEGTFTGGVTAGAGQLRVIPFAEPEREPLLAGAVRFIPLDAACAVNGFHCFSGLYVRLHGVEHYSQHSVMLLQATAAAITAHTGLHVDILDGSSMRSVTVVSSLPNAGEVGRSSWRVVGVAVQLVEGVDGLQELLLVLCAAVCMLAIGAAAILAGIGRRKETLLLLQLGWQRSPVLCALLLDAFICCIPGFMLAVSWMALSSMIWRSHLSWEVLALLLVMGVIVYCGVTVNVGCSGMMGGRKGRSEGRWGEQRGEAKSAGQGDHKGSPLPWYESVARGYLSMTRTIKIKGKSFLNRVFRLGRSGGNFVGVMPRVASCIAISAAVFLIAVIGLMLIDFNRELVVTVLGRQVREVLEAPQLVMLALVLLAVIMTVWLCTALILQWRREEIRLLSFVGWERHVVLARILWDNWRAALLSGEVGILLALVVTALGGAVPGPLTIVVLGVCGPLMGVLLVSVAAMGPAWRETKRVF